MKIKTCLPVLFFACVMLSCGPTKESDVPIVGFVDYLQDETLSQARTGFMDALKKAGFSEQDNTVKIAYQNAENSQPTLNQIVSKFVADDVKLLATCTTLSTLTAVQKTKTIPIFEMVSPTPERMKVLDANGKAPTNLFGAMEDLQYIDTSFHIIPQLLKPKGKKLVIGMIYNQAEPQSADAMQHIKELSDAAGITLLALPLNTSADAQLVTRSLLEKNIDAFFANPDNTVFASFETILKNCNEANVPIFTSEAGLVQRGAVAAFGADIYQWGYQAGEQAAQFLKSGKTDGLQLQMVKVRKRVYNADAAKKFNVTVPGNFELVK